MIHRTLLLIFLFTYFIVNCSGQTIPLVLRKWLSNEELLKIRKSQELVEQGKSILFEFNKDSALKLEDSYENLTIDFVVNKKTGRQLIDAKDYFFNGYKGQIDIYQTYIDYYIRKNKDNAPHLVISNNDTITKMISEAESLMKKSSTKGSIKVAGEMIHQANFKMYGAVVLSQLTMIDIQNINFSIANKQKVEVSAEEEVDKPSNEVNSSNIDKVIVQPIVDENKVELSVNKKQEIRLETELQPQIYYTIQILADKKPISNERLKAIYKGDLPIVKNQGGGWYRYSIGKFADYIAAKNALSKAKITGYIVAYSKSERITVAKAKELLGK